MIPNWDALTVGEQFIVGWQYPETHILGDFKAFLAHTISHADDYNLAKLDLGFPDEVEAYRKYTGEEGWWEMVQKKAGITK